MFIRTDDSNAFGQEPLFKINFSIPENETVIKAKVIINSSMIIEYDSPKFPLEVHFNSKQSALLKDDNNVDLVLYDGNNRQYSIPNIANFKTRKGVL